MTGPLPSTLQRLPMVGRAAELRSLADALERARAGRGRAVLIGGGAGVGKSRLVSAAAEEARRQGWQVVNGRAYPVETGIPYAIFSDAFVPFLQTFEPGTLSVLARGGREWLDRLFPPLRGPHALPASDAGADERVQLFWNFARFLGALSARAPLLVALDDLHAADVSSIELFHFLARQLGSEPVVFVASVLTTERDRQPALHAMQRSLASLDLLETIQLDALTAEEADDLVRQVFGAGQAVTREFTALLYGWTRGNPFFIEETLKTLVESGRLRREGSGWLGWELSELRLPPSVRDAVLLRLGALSAPARELADVAAVLGGRAGLAELRAAAGLGEDALVDAVEELRRAGVLAEVDQDGRAAYEFEQPIVRETLLGEIGLARRRRMHARVAEALEGLYGAAAFDHAEALAAHFVRAGDAAAGGRAARYLLLAGQRALKRSASREAADYLGAALERLGTAAADGDEPPVDRFALLVDLARARQRLGDFDDALARLDQARELATGRGDDAGAALTLRRIGLSHFFAGRIEAALAALAEGISAAERAGHEDLLCRAELARGAALLAAGRPEEARAALEHALAAAERGGDPATRARAHRGLLVFHTMSGPPGAARAHGERAIELARVAGDLAAAGTCHWAMAVLEGLNGRSAECQRHVDSARALAETLGSPLLHLAVEEVAVQHAHSTGDWDTGLALGERAIALARTLNQVGVLPRLLAWTGMIYLGRDQLERAKAYLDEALALVEEPGRTQNVHSAVPVHLGHVLYHLALHQYERAREVGERALALVDRTGYRAWAVHRLLPAILEANLHLRDLDAARRVAERLRRDAAELQHHLGLVWADAGEAVSTWLSGDVQAAVVTMRRAAEALENVPFVPDAARVRRQLAGRLADLGDREGALRELRHVHEVFLRLGAQGELQKARIQFHELGARPPVRAAGAGAGGLTARELEIIRLLSGHLSNKAIAKELGISARTVGTHLSNIFRKLDLSTRAELATFARTLTA